MNNTTAESTPQDQQQNEENRTEERKEFNLLKISLINSSLFLALLTGLAILKGYAYLEKYYSVFNIPIDRLNFTTQKITLYGTIDLMALIIAVLIFLAASATVACIISIAENPKNQSASKPLPQWMQSLADRLIRNRMAISLTLLLIAFALIGYALFHVAVTKPIELAKTNAAEAARNCIEYEIKLMNSEKYTGCIIAESDDMIYAIKRVESEEAPVYFSTAKIPKNRFLSAYSLKEKSI